MSSVEEAKEKIGSASDAVDAAIQSVEALEEAVEDASKLFDDAAGGVDHDHVQAAVAAYNDVKDKLAEVKTSLAAARDAGELYSTHLG